MKSNCCSQGLMYNFLFLSKKEHAEMYRVIELLMICMLPGVCTIVLRNKANIHFIYHSTIFLLNPYVLIFLSYNNN